jgi:hypothetical protein
MTIETLALCSKVLYDERLLELRQEVESLRLRIFWLTHGKRRFTETMHRVNEHSICCACLFCCVAGRQVDRRDEVSNNNDALHCLFRARFESYLRKHGLTWVYNTGTPVHIPIVDDGHPSARHCYDVDAHFVVFGQGHWISWAFGKKLWQATSPLDPELIRYTSFLKTYTT